MNCGYRFLVCLFGFLLLIEESLPHPGLSRAFMTATMTFRHVIASEESDRTFTFIEQLCSISWSRFSDAFVKVPNRIFAVLVKASPSREMYFNDLNINVKVFYEI